MSIHSLDPNLIRHSGAAFAYVGRRTCGCVVCAVVDASGEQMYVAKVLAEWKVEGKMIERVTVEKARELLAQTVKSACFQREHKPAHLTKAPAQGKQESLL